jgi:hypothetical protein
MGKWKERHTEQVYNFYCSPGIGLVTPKMRRAGHTARMVEMRKACRIMANHMVDRGADRCTVQGTEWFHLALNRTNDGTL